MDTERYRRVRMILQEAGRLEGEARERYLEAQDPDVCAEVRRLLAAAAVDTGALYAVPPDTAAPPESVGACAVVRELGRGGMGVVYEATRDGERVAVKVMHPWLQVTTRFGREAEMGRAVRHENVVRTLDAGPDYIVMEYVEGKTLRALLEELGRVPETLLREITRQAAAGLAAIHEAGIVHRDLKPENILITRDERVRIMDLGIAKQQQASVALTGEGQFLGSLQYASPEQCEVGEVTGAADLYALGVVLYELATGENPFARDTAGEVIVAQLEFQPRAAYELNPDISPFLAEFLTTLLAKQPAARFASAKEVLDTLEAGEAGAWWKSREGAVRARNRPDIGLRKETEIHGREGELRLLHDAFAAACEGQGGTLLIEGEAGLGKSRLVDAFLQTLPGEDTHLLYGSFPPTAGMGGLLDAISAKFGAGLLEEALRPYLRATPRLIPALAALVRREPLKESLADDALEALCCRLAQALAKERPTIWVVDDLHYAPEVGRATALAMARAAAGHRILLVLTTRPGTDTAGFSRVDGFRRLLLPRLTEEAVLAIVREKLGATGLAQEIAAKSAGIPFFAFEIVRSLKETDALVEDADGAWVPSGATDGIAVPSAVRDLVASRLRGLSKQERSILDVGAVQGFLFDADLAASALELSIVAVLQDLAEVQRRLGVVHAAGRLYRFDHHLVQEVLYSELPERLREEYHTRVADACRDRGDAPFLALHYLRGARPEAALPHLEEALRILENRYLHEDALELLDRALPLFSDATRVDFLLQRAKRLGVVGRYVPQLQSAEEALAIAQRLSDPLLQGRARLAVALCLLRISRETEALDHYRDALQCGDAPTQMEALAGIGLILGRFRRSEEALVHHERAYAMAIQAGDRAMELRTITNMAMALRHLNRYEEARVLLDTHLRGIVDKRAETNLQGSLGPVLRHLGRFEEAVRALRRQNALALETGNRHPELSSTGNLGIVLRDMALFAEALECSRRHLRMATEIGVRRSQAVALLNLGRLHRSLGDEPAARRMLGEARDIGREVKAYHLYGIAVLGLGDPDEALAVFREINDREETAGALVALGAFDEALPLAEELDLPALRFQALLGRGHVDAAADVLAADAGRFPHEDRMRAHFDLHVRTRDEAHLAEARRLLAFAVEHAPPECREAMVANVELHRAIERGTA